MFRKILPCDSTAGVLNDLPKVHKTGCPFRSIISPVNIYNYDIAYFLVKCSQTDLHEPIYNQRLFEFCTLGEVT